MQRVPRPPLSLLLYWAVLLLALYGFAVLAGEIYDEERFAFDAPLLTWLNTHQTPVVTRLALVLNLIGGAYLLTPLTLLLAGVFWTLSRRTTVFLLLSFFGAVAVNLVAKAFFASARPDLFDALSPAVNYSFPSGHAMGSSAFALALYFALNRHYPRYRWLVAVLGLLFALGVGFSRPYLQVHYPSDILAGWALSLAWVMGVNAWYTRRR